MERYLADAGLLHVWQQRGHGDGIPALWTFVRVEGVEPTNNHGERVLRLAVLWRKCCFGCHSETGCRFVERLLTAVQSLRLQKRSALAFLRATIQAHRAGGKTPSLLPTG